ncbi:AraC-like ligand binding domain-containing protein [Paenibacillus sp. 1_12]|uniref:AraC family transcriptional regulator n=1 Tax=Paenibacillus sp. 1_12 TaxID=1566278 RepID=UPI0008F040A3|nr:AraC family transcriptional regulator [Paenibacillus sp. 1_12]SFK82710.1 AraC-like ligand binding domain-containing protein [Paenibacillus sp. 1_12]
MSIVSDPFQFDYRRTSELQFREVFHAHPQMEFTYVHRGSGNLIIEGKTYSIEPSTLMIFQPFQLHRVQMHVTSDSPFIRTVMMFDPALLKPYWASFPVIERFFLDLQKQASGKPIHSIRESEPIITHLGTFNETRSKLNEHEIKEEFHFFLLGFLRQLKTLWHKPDDDPSIPARRHHHRAEEVMQWIEEHYQEAFNLEQLAKELHLSPYHIAHLFKQATGATIVAYTQATRIRHACVHLITSSLTVPEIGARVGIPNPSYFCRVFRQTMGSTPHQYRLHIHKRT